MGQEIENILDDCLEEMKQGKSLRDCLAKYPQFTSELEPMLILADKIKGLPKPRISQETVSATLMEVGRISSLEKKESLWKGFPGLRPMMIRAIAAGLIIIMLGWPALKVSATSFPGDFLYPVKLMTEKVKYMLTFNPEGKVELHITFSEERLKELINTVRKGRSIDEEVIRMMLDEAQRALNKTALLPAPKAHNLLKKIDQLNSYQKTTLEKIRTEAKPEQEWLIDSAIEMCGRNGKWINEMCREDNGRYPGGHCPWR